MDNIKVYKPPGCNSQVEAFIEGLEPKLRNKLVTQIFRLSRTPPAGLKEPHYKHFSIFLVVHCHLAEAGFNGSDRLFSYSKAQQLLCFTVFQY